MKLMLGGTIERVEPTSDATHAITMIGKQTVTLKLSGKVVVADSPPQDLHDSLLTLSLPCALLRGTRLGDLFTVTVEIPEP